ncbi:hypothetical protein GCM10025867_17820 [Frondihabitans sucicola]|uniref:Tetrapyrrole methylase domain-containing protein n=1 Tax=Frondihabitans sucicola TaxID=1268041 RepID=A0ABM8GMB4_9MICO|nr:hypothetical protein GCM10025867_17820 [Frondihabitans sucicola]
MGSVIVLAATPIGNLGDASARLIEALTNTEVIAAEDTRTAIHLMRALGIENRPRLIALHEHNERDKAAEVVELGRSADVLVLTDAGMPAISDPGFPLVEAAAAAGVTVTALPGPSAVLMALAVSGLPTDRFTFEGFLPRKQGDRQKILRSSTRSVAPWSSSSRPTGWPSRSPTSPMRSGRIAAWSSAANSPSSTRRSAEAPPPRSPSGLSRVRAARSAS